MGDTYYSDGESISQLVSNLGKGLRPVGRIIHCHHSWDCPNPITTFCMHVECYSTCIFTSWEFPCLETLITTGQYQVGYRICGSTSDVDWHVPKLNRCTTIKVLCKIIILGAAVRSIRNDHFITQFEYGRMS